jgi:shikimate kinase
MNIFFCGLPGCGKTTFGKIVAQELQKQFIDVDSLIEHEYGNQYSCREIFSKIGEDAFRTLEKRKIESLAQQSSSIVALGGGSFELKENIVMIKNQGIVLYLKASPEILFARRKDLVFLDKEDPKTCFLEIAMRRSPRYEEAATITIEIDFLKKEEITQKILETICQIRSEDFLQ